MRQAHRLYRLLDHFQHHATLGVARVQHALNPTSALGPVTITVHVG
jgi:hypothetical protein